MKGSSDPEAPTSAYQNNSLPTSHMACMPKHRAVPCWGYPWPHRCTCCMHAQLLRCAAGANKGSPQGQVTSGTSSFAPCGMLSKLRADPDDTPSRAGSAMTAISSAGPRSGSCLPCMRFLKGPLTELRYSRTLFRLVQRMVLHIRLVRKYYQIHSHETPLLLAASSAAVHVRISKN